MKETKFVKTAEKVVGDSDKELLKEIEQRSCPDCFVAKIEIEIHNNVGHIKYLVSSITEYENRVPLDKTLSEEDYPVIAIVLESPHKAEFEGDISPLKNNTSSNFLYKYLIRNLFDYITTISNPCGTYSRRTSEIENGVYRIKLVNAVQFQCSLGKDLSESMWENNKNRIVETCLNESGFKESLVERLKDATIIINCCTGQKDGKIDGLQKQVQEIIDQNYPKRVRLYGYHPSSQYFFTGFKKVQ